MASYDYAKALAEFDESVAITSSVIDGYLRVHWVETPAPATLPGEHGEIVERYYPDEAARNASDWRRF